MKSPFEQKEQKEQKESAFNWSLIGDIGVGRANLGADMPVSVYRLFVYTMRATLIREFGRERTAQLQQQSGELAGREFAQHVLNTSLGFNAFFEQLRQTMADMKMGIFRIEEFDSETGSATVTVSEDLDCSGLPEIGEAVCSFDEGFIAGIFSEYTARPYQAIEINCWAKGDRVCRFRAEEKKEN